MKFNKKRTKSGHASDARKLGGPIEKPLDTALEAALKKFTIKGSLVGPKLEVVNGQARQAARDKLMKDLLVGDFGIIPGINFTIIGTLTGRFPSGEIIK